MYMFININIKETPNARVNAESDGRKMLKRATRGAWVPTSYVLRDIKTGVEDQDGNTDVATRPTQLRWGVVGC
jgi:hypothetical protein